MSDEKTLRDEFATAAMQGWLASFGPDAPHPANQVTRQRDFALELAVLSYAMADAMLTARQAKGLP